MAKDVGAKKVIFASCAPPIRYLIYFFDNLLLFSKSYNRYPNVYGIDMPSRQELVAHGRNTDEIAAAIGADIVIFQTLSDLENSVRQFNPSITTFDCSVFTGDYVTGGVGEEYLQHIEDLRADNARGKLKTNMGTLLESVGDSAPQHSISPLTGSDDTVGLHNSWNTV